MVLYISIGYFIWVCANVVVRGGGGGVKGILALLLLYIIFIGC